MSSLFENMKNALGFAPKKSRIYADSDELENSQELAFEEVEEFLTPVSKVEPTALLDSTKEDEETTENPLDPVTEEQTSPTDTHYRVPEEVLCRVVSLLNEPLPPFLKECIDIDAEKKYIDTQVAPLLEFYVQQRCNEMLSTTLDHRTQEDKQLHTDYEALQERCQKALLRAEESQAALLSSERQKEAVTKRANDLNKQLVALEQEQEEFQREKLRLQEWERTSEATHQQLNHQITELTQQLTLQSEELASKSESLEEAHQLQERLTSELTQQKEQLQTLQNTLTEQSAQSSTSTEEFASLTEELERATLERDEVQKALLELQKQQKQTSTQTEAAEAELSALKTTHAAQAAQMATMQENLVSLQESKKQLQLAKEEVANQLEIALGEKRALEEQQASQVTADTEDTKRLKHEVLVANDMLTALKSQRQDLLNNVEKMHQEKLAQEHEITLLRAQLAAQEVLANTPKETLEPEATPKPKAKKGKTTKKEEPKTETVAAKSEPTATVEPLITATTTTRVVPEPASLVLPTQQNTENWMQYTTFETLEKEQANESSSSSKNPFSKKRKGKSTSESLFGEVETRVVTPEEDASQMSLW